MATAYRAPRLYVDEEDLEEWEAREDGSKFCNDHTRTTAPCVLHSVCID